MLRISQSISPKVGHPRPIRGAQPGHVGRSRATCWSVASPAVFSGRPAPSGSTFCTSGLSPFLFLPRSPAWRRFVPARSPFAPVPEFCVNGCFRAGPADAALMPQCSLKYLSSSRSPDQPPPRCVRGRLGMPASVSEHYLAGRHVDVLERPLPVRRCRPLAQRLRLVSAPVSCQLASVIRTCLRWASSLRDGLRAAQLRLDPAGEAGQGPAGS